MEIPEELRKKKSDVGANLKEKKRAPKRQGNVIQGLGRYSKDDKEAVEVKLSDTIEVTSPRG